MERKVGTLEGRGDVWGGQLVGINGRVTESGISGGKMRDREQSFWWWPFHFFFLFETVIV